MANNQNNKWRKLRKWMHKQKHFNIIQFKMKIPLKCLGNKQLH